MSDQQPEGREVSSVKREEREIHNPPDVVDMPPPEARGPRPEASSPPLHASRTPSDAPAAEPAAVQSWRCDACGEINNRVFDYCGSCRKHKPIAKTNHASRFTLHEPRPRSPKPDADSSDPVFMPISQKHKELIPAARAVCLAWSPQHIALPRFDKSIEDLRAALPAEELRNSECGIRNEDTILDVLAKLRRRLDLVEEICGARETIAVALKRIESSELRSNKALDALTEQITVNGELADLIATLRKALQAEEWGRGNEDWCPCCAANRQPHSTTDGHYAHCALRAALDESAPLPDARRPSDVEGAR